MVDPFEIHRKDRYMKCQPVMIPGTDEVLPGGRNLRAATEMLFWEEFEFIKRLDAFLTCTIL